jgi:hypothetical protein
MTPVGFEPTFSAGERKKTYALDCAATGTGCVDTYGLKLKPEYLWFLHVYVYMTTHFYIVREDRTV